MATVGSGNYSTPDAGWKRYENSEPLIRYDSSWDHVADANASGGTISCAQRTRRSSLAFAFTGTKVRIIVRSNMNPILSNSTMVRINKGTAQYIDSYVSGYYKYLIFEKTGLPQGKHLVEIQVQSAAPSYQWDFMFDAFEIDSTGSIISVDEVVKSTLYKKSSGLILRDDFLSLESYWSLSPSNSINISQRPGFMRLKNNLGQDTSSLLNVPEGFGAMEIIADFTPTVVGDEAGVLLWKDANDKVEFLERYDAQSSVNQSNWLIEMNGNVCDLYSDSGSGYGLVDSRIIEITKIGVIKKSSQSVSAKDLDIDKVLVTSSRVLSVLNLSQNQKVRIEDSQGNTVIESVVGPTLVGNLKLPRLECTGTLKVLDANGVMLQSIPGTFYGGDVYSVGAELQVRIEGTELLANDMTSIGPMVGGEYLMKLNVYNPSTLVAYNVRLGVSQYMSKFGYQWVDIAPDVNGVPGTYGDFVDIAKLDPGNRVDIWMKVTKGTDYLGLEPLRFNIHLNHL